MTGGKRRVGGLEANRVSTDATGASWSTMIGASRECETAGDATPEVSGLRDRVVVVVVVVVVRRLVIDD